MRSLSDQNFYETLDISSEASLQSIERAYRIARATYQPSSAATYSVFSEEESSEILRRVEEAYSVLSEARLRREYDARLRREQLPDRTLATREPRPTPPSVDPSPAPPQVEMDLEDSLEPEDGVYDGPVLRRIRMSRGIELEEISVLTKINELYLQFIESNRYHDLPAPVYLRGFVREIAKCLRLDARQVTESYMQIYHQREARGS